MVTGGVDTGGVDIAEWLLVVRILVECIVPSDYRMCGCWWSG